jgi:signal transduction histidine kinase
VLLEHEGAELVVSVRDDGRGFSPARLAEARAEGRLGVASSIAGRVRDLGGTMAVESAPGAGTEVELRVPAEGAT